MVGVSDEWRPGADTIYDIITVHWGPTQMTNISDECELSLGAAVVRL